MNNIVEALHFFVPNSQWTVSGEEYADITWLDTKIAKPTEKEVDDMLLALPELQAKQTCKTMAQAFLQQTDWATLSDVINGNPKLVNQSEFLTYRAEVRSLVLNPVVNPTFPVMPKSVWE